LKPHGASAAKKNMITENAYSLRNVFCQLFCHRHSALHLWFKNVHNIYSQS